MKLTVIILTYNEELHLARCLESAAQLTSHIVVVDCFSTDRTVEIAKALRANPKILILDEPTSGLSETEINVLFGILRQLKAQGIGIVVITHKLNEIFAISDRIMVLRDGQTIQTWPIASQPPEPRRSRITLSSSPPALLP